MKLKKHKTRQKRYFVALITGREALATHSKCRLTETLLLIIFYCLLIIVLFPLPSAFICG